MNEKKKLTTEETFSLAFKNHKKNNLQVAENLYKKILKINPEHFNSIFYLGTLLSQTKRFNLAKPLLEKAIQIEPNYSHAHNNLGIVFQDLGQHQKAISSYEKTIQIEPNYAIAHNNLGNVLSELGEHQKAISSYEKAIQIQPNYSHAHDNLGMILQKLGEHQKAISSYEKAIQIQPNYAKAHNNLGIVLQELGEHQKAMSFYQMAVKYEPENLVHLYHLSGLDGKILHSNLKNKIYKIIEKNNSTKENISYGNFLLSRYELKAKKYKNEFDHLLKGHQYYFESEERKFKKGIDYWLNVLPKRKKLINLNRHNKNIKIDNYVIKPIFIIGVPRCGSTLIEKVIASGSQYIPIGEETGIIHNVVKNLINHDQSLNSDIENFQTKIVETYKQKGLVQKKNNYMFTDKSLENFFYIDIIKEIFPQAKIINCRRNALSSIMSTLKNNLKILAWAHNLEHIFKYYDIYHQMIKNFEKTHSNFIYNLQYEKFVSDPENEAKKLMNFCGLAWDVKCLDFYKRKDLISKTASNFQIRKAIYKDSINKYLPYKQFLYKYENKYSWFN
tara:strand:- start:153 stop:1826 length:1674 start_codon:yes stop_codon:yes gene_type:complete